MVKMPFKCEFGRLHQAGEFASVSSGSPKTGCLHQTDDSGSALSDRPNPETSLWQDKCE